MTELDKLLENKENSPREEKLIAIVRELKEGLEQLFDNVGYIRESVHHRNSLLFKGFKIAEENFIPPTHKEAFRDALEALAIAKKALSRAEAIAGEV